VPPAAREPPAIDGIRRHAFCLVFVSRTFRK
jgi:hypothetical protein